MCSQGTKKALQIIGEVGKVVETSLNNLDDGYHKLIRGLLLGILDNNIFFSFEFTKKISIYMLYVMMNIDASKYYTLRNYLLVKILVFWIKLK